ncbi:MAG: hypothetical protein QXY22_04765 [Candidatus Nitrosotenuis sp.]|uniref:Intracellular proteinase inhibitor BsuPI domain-containing protein n=1 Tax=Candidatus Nitrosotenuis uzonensis TaxID=1407055 RepID=A0A812EYQ1_9ARCH|nr:hypothetical protein [Candidatus Nitrosotenuis uzonensis]CAE6484732.1 conserved hypothetical protein [Candidatus Nitrosotenuis uzonensis]
MLPKGLVIAVVSGVLASGVLGAYFIKIASEQYELEFVEGPSVSVMVEKPDYKLGETVRITIINSGTEKIEIAKDLPTIQIRALDGTVFYSEYLSPLILEQKQERFFDWNQRKSDGSQVLEGRYVVDVLVYGEDKQKLTDRLTINILK